MKLISYVAVNDVSLADLRLLMGDTIQWFRMAGSQTQDADETKGLQRYPQNLNVKDLYYFMVAPTLCYELNFPR